MKFSEQLRQDLRAKRLQEFERQDDVISVVLFLALFGATLGYLL
mgnify:CR=1 FL=1